MEIDRIHFYVVDALRTRDLLIEQIGLQALGERVNEHTIEYLVGNDNLLFSIASPLTAASPVADYLARHPSGVKDVSFRVTDLNAIRKRIESSRTPILATSDLAEDVEWIKIRGWGGIEHTITQARSKSIKPAIATTDSIISIDHVVLNVPAGDLEMATVWYIHFLGFKVQQNFNIQSKKSGLTSKALISPCGRVRFNINEPSSSNSQIQEFLDLNCGAGIQHIALQTNDILSTVDRLGQQELAFLSIPQAYYTNLRNRANSEQNLLLTNDEWQQLERLQILMDWSSATPTEILLQIFTQPIFESPTFFFELIERRNRAQGFGQGNFQALFEAIEEYNSI
ncbi:4-hydroxyphenylpyruvate dioxygenase [Chamaesiphon sp. VAR_48_metabat_403]|uniref:4-hydroxyphenylpyruvate dioxygenase n=1 Tax=Chamaesiphon sp. VAR_48_metabat_403 TaxID=2964700 RepID=UPI00286E13C3|nr:4-hydroxyphenylpyruvate dioxygenase [Chamaesiphon sp. VAR_48_metabat_403]